MATISGPASELAEISRLASEAVDTWLQEYDGYCGLIVFTDEPGGRSRVITLWETPEAEETARTARGAMRDQLAATAGMSVDDFGVWEVAVFEIPDEL
jgi:hypothetical protein